MRTKIVNGTFHLKKKGFIFLEGEIKPIKQICGKLRIVENEGITYVVCPVSNNTLDGPIIPIIENYDSLEEVK